MSELLLLQDLAEKIAREAGQLLRDRPSKFTLDQKSGLHDFATQMDHKSEALITERIRSARPDDGLLGEEGAAQESRSGFTWVIDPIDGTVNYLYGIPGWCVSIAVKDGEGFAVGVVYSPMTEMLWKAARGHGAFLNDEKIHCNDPVEINRALLGTGFAYDITRRNSQATLVKDLLPQIRDIRRLGACAVDISMVGSGQLDGFLEAGVFEWDIAAACVIATEAGARVNRRKVWGQKKEFIIVAGPALHADLEAVISAQGLMEAGDWA